MKVGVASPTSGSSPQVWVGAPFTVMVAMGTSWRASYSDPPEVGAIRDPGIRDGSAIHPRKTSAHPIPLVGTGSWD